MSEGSSFLLARGYADNADTAEKTKQSDVAA